MDPKSAASTMIENGEISEGQREEQRKLNPSTLSFILILASCHMMIHGFLIEISLFSCAGAETK